MKNKRKEQIKDLMESFHVLKHGMAPHAVFSKNMAHITPAQIGVLMLLKKQNTSAVKDIANQLCVSSSAATQLIDELVKNGHIIRKTNPKDRREVMLSLSKNIDKIIKKIEEHLIDNAFNLFSVLSDKEFEQYIKLNEKIIQKSLAKAKQ